VREIERFPRPHDGMSDVVTGQSYTPGIHKDSPFIDQYQGLIDGEWVDVDQVRVIRTANHNSCTCRNMCPWCRYDDEG
jgi:hypothetical protein